MPSCHQGAPSGDPTPDPHGLDMLCMDQTFHDRRQKLIYENMSIHELINSYLWLQGDGVIYKIARISEKNILMVY